MRENTCNFIPPDLMRELEEGHISLQLETPWEKGFRYMTGCSLLNLRTMLSVGHHLKTGEKFNPRTFTVHNIAFCLRRKEKKHIEFK